MSQRLLTIAEAAELTGATVKAIRNRVDRGQLRAVKRGGVRKIPLSELARIGLVPLAGSGGGGEHEAIGEAAEEARELVSRELLAELARAHERLGALQALEATSQSTKAELEADLEAKRRTIGRLEDRAAEAELELERLRSRSLLERLRNR